MAAFTTLSGVHCRVNNFVFHLPCKLVFHQRKTAINTNPSGAVGKALRSNDARGSRRDFNGSSGRRRAPLWYVIPLCVSNPALFHVCASLFPISMEIFHSFFSNEISIFCKLMLVVWFEANVDRFHLIANNGNDTNGSGAAQHLMTFKLSLNSILEHFVCCRHSFCSQNKAP